MGPLLAVSLERAKEDTFFFSPQHKAQGAETKCGRVWVRIMGYEKEPYVPGTWPVHTQLTKDTIAELSLKETKETLMVPFQDGTKVASEAI